MLLMKRQMRTIKFRFWQPSTRTMQKWEDYQQYGIFEMFNNVDSIPLQFTGLTDKNGVEIYEGDILTYKRSVGNWTGQFITTTHKIVFSDEVFAFVMKYGTSYIKLRKHWGYEYEIVGNIYQNEHFLNT